jgi:hypothetical protein
MQSQREFQMRGNTWTAMIVLILLLVGLFFLARGVFWLLSMLAPVLLIAALIIDYKVAVGYVKWLIRLVKQNWVFGLGAVLLTVIGYPVVFAFLFGKALLNRRIQQAQEEALEGDYIDFEEVSKEGRVELPPLREKEKRTDYDNLFEE